MNTWQSFYLPRNNERPGRHLVILNTGVIPAHRNNNNMELWKCQLNSNLRIYICIIYNNHGRFFHVHLQIEIMAFLSW